MSNLALDAKTMPDNQYTLLEHLPVMALICDAAGVIHYLNPEAEQFAHNQSLQTTKISDFLSGFNIADLHRAIVQLNADEQFNTHLKFGHPEQYYQLRIVKDHYKDTDYHHNKQYFLLFLSLLRQQPPSTKQKHPNSLLKKNFKELKQFSRLSAMREISTSMADKLNQPLTAILSYTQAMQRLYNSNASSAEIIGAMERVVINAKNAGEIIRQIRQQLKTNTLNYQLININELIQESVSLTELDNPAFNINLITDYAPPHSKIYVDKIQLRQVIFSLLNNAIDALLTANIPQAEIKIKTHKSEQYYTISISDNGPGLPGEIKNNPFEPFSSTKINSIGIGLSMCHYIVALHQGHISIKSDAHGMTIVTIVLPVNITQPKQLKINGAPIV